MDLIDRIERLVTRIIQNHQMAVSSSRIRTIAKNLSKEGFFVPSTKIGNLVWFLDFPQKDGEAIQVVPATVIKYAYVSTPDRQIESATIYFKGRDGIMTYQDAVYNDTVFSDKKEADQKAYFLSNRRKGENNGKTSSI